MTERQKELIDEMIQLYGIKVLTPLYEGDTYKIMLNVYTLDQYIARIKEANSYRLSVDNGGVVAHSLGQKILARYMETTGKTVSNDEAKHLLQSVVEVLQENSI